MASDDVGGDIVTRIATDRILCGYTIVNQSAGYANGSIWINTNASTANDGTVPYVNGVVDHPSRLLEDALAISLSTSIIQFNVVSASTIMLIANASYMTGLGYEWNLNLNGQLVTAATVVGATITGSAHVDSTDTHAHNCHLGTCGLTPGTYSVCSMDDVITLLAPGTYVFDANYSGISGDDTPTIDFNNVAGPVFLNLRHHSGGVLLVNMSADDVMSFEGDGQIKVDASCSGGFIAVRGNVPRSGAGEGNITWSEESRYEREMLVGGAWPLASDSNGIVESNTVQWLGTAVNASLAGYPDTNVWRLRNSDTSAALLANFANNGWDDANDRVYSDILAIAGTTVEASGGNLKVVGITGEELAEKRTGQPQ
jgi:hypothetical protein